MNFRNWNIILGLCALVLGCTKGNPTFSDLGSDNIPQPLFSGASSETLQSATATQTYVISGECDPKIESILATTVGLTTAQVSLNSLATTSSVSINCGTTGKFSFTLKSLTDLGFTIVDNRTYDIELRGVTSGGLSRSSLIHIVYSTGGGPDAKQIKIISGATESNSGPRLATSTSFNAVIRVSNRAPAYTGSPTADEVVRKTPSGDVKMVPTYPDKAF